MSEIRVIQNGARVLLLIDGKRVEGMPHHAAMQLSRALAGVAKLADEWDQAERIVADQALLMRAGAPFGLSDNPKIIAEARKQAELDRDLRRYLPRPAIPAIASRETFGAPTIRQTPPEEQKP